jgi:hypothetical protein
MNFSFSNETNEMRLMAAFCAQLVREGVTFKVTNVNGYFNVELTGGF